MSIFDKDLVCGKVGDVIRMRNMTYASGRSIYSPITAHEAADLDDEYGDYFRRRFTFEFPELNTESEWPLFYDGFNCNIGEMFYENMFKQDFVKHVENPTPGVQLITEAALQGKLDSIFTPIHENWISRSNFDAEYNNTHIEYSAYWEMVRNSMIAGIKESLDDNITADVYIRKMATSVYRCNFFITLIPVSHKEKGSMYWPKPGSYMEHSITGQSSTYIMIPPVVADPIVIPLLVEFEFNHNENLDSWP